MNTISASVFQLSFRGDTLARWTSFNPVLADREFVLETDTGQFKVGDGTTAYLSLPYGGIVGPTGPQGTSIVFQRVSRYCRGLANRGERSERCVPRRG